MPLYPQLVVTGRDAALAVSRQISVMAQQTGSSVAEAGSIFNDLLPYLNYGVLGFVLMALLSRKFLVPAWTVDDLKESFQRERDESLRERTRLEKDLDEATDKNEALNLQLVDKILPIAIQAQGYAHDLLDLQREQVAERAADRRRARDGTA